MSTIIHQLFQRFLGVFGLCLLSLSTLAVGQTGDENQALSTSLAPTDVDTFLGAFTTRVDFEVPAFRGITPRIGLSYNSSAGNGPVGVGWTLDGIATIQRAAPARGAPHYDATDIFILDGVELVPSTEMGGTHCTRVQDFRRIAFDAGQNRWTIKTKDGTTTVLLPTGTIGAPVFRWSVATVTDPSGNVVTYTHSFDGGDSYPATITYNGATVRFWWEARSDPISFATGLPVLGATAKRLRSVDVLVSGARARAYGMVYAEAPASERSLLTNVRHYGRTAAMSALGVPSGTSLPQSIYSYDALWTASFAPTLYAGLHLRDNGAWNKLGDFNGDGRTDILAISNPNFANSDVHINYANAGGSGFTRVNFNNVYAATVPEYNIVGDFDGDGRSDLLSLISPALGATVSTIARIDWSGAGPTFNDDQVGGMNYHPVNGIRLLGDFNGDGRTDFLWFDTGYDVSHVHYATGSGFAVSTFPTSQIRIEQSSGAYNLVGDYNGDGRADILAMTSTSTGTVANDTGTISFSTGTGFVRSNFSNVYFRGQGEKNLLGDFNGDGKQDVLSLIGSGTNTAGFINYSTGNALTAVAVVIPWINGNDMAHTKLGDFDGDGRTDILSFNVMNRSGTTDAWLQLCNGHGFTPTHLQNLWMEDSGRKLGDYDGDGRTDILQIWNATSGNNSTVYLNRSAIPRDLMRSVGGSLGASTQVLYTPSTVWPNAFMPSGMVLQTVSQVTTNDGRGVVSTLDHEYAQGLFNVASRRFLGFGTVTTNLDSDGNTSVTVRAQTEGSAGRPTSVTYRSPNNSVLAKTEYIYTETSNAPFRSFLSMRTDSEYTGSGTMFRQRRQEMIYDAAYGNLVEKREHGDLAVTGDERTTLRTYYPNASAFIVGSPAREDVGAGLGSSGTLLKRTEWRYDGASTTAASPAIGRVTKERRWKGTSLGYAETTFAYDAYGNVIQELDALGGATTTAYDSAFHLHPVSVTNALGHVTTFSWDPPLGLKLTQTDANGAVTTWTYDAFGRKVTETRPGGGTTNWTYSSWGTAAAQRTREAVSDGTPDGLWHEAWFDGLGRTWKEVREGAGERISVYRDTSKRPWKESRWKTSAESAQNDVFAYDGLGRLVSLTHADGSASTVVYGPGYVDLFDELNRRRSVWRDVFGRTTRVQEWNGASAASTTYAYDLLDRLLQVTDAAGNVSSFTWNPAGWKLSSSDVDAGSVTYGYDGKGRLVSQTDARGQTVAMTYDALDRLRTRRWADGTFAGRWYYDEAGHGAGIGRATTVVHPLGAESRVYDLEGRELQVARTLAGTTRTFTSTYDLAGRLTTLTYPDGETVIHAYDASGRIAQLGNYVDGVVWRPDNTVAQIAFSNGTTSTYAFDAARGRLTGASLAHGTAGTLFQESYVFDVAGRLVTQSSTTHATGNLQYSYDHLDRLVAVAGLPQVSRSYAYNAIGNMTSNSTLGSYSYGNAAHRHAVTAIAGTSYAYDASGNMTQRGADRLTWDPDHRLSSAAGPSGKAVYGYDAQGRMISRSQGNGTTLFFGPLLEVEGGRETSSYFLGSVLVARRCQSDIRWQFTDRLGSLRLETTLDGAVTARYDYDAFGRKVVAQPGMNQPVAFGGHLQDGNGLLYLHGRWYDPAIGRFLQPDPIVRSLENPQSLNRYAYAENNPVGNIDPTGHLKLESLDTLLTVAIIVATAGWGTIPAYLALAGGAAAIYGYETGNEKFVQAGNLLLTVAGTLANAKHDKWVTAIYEAAMSADSPLDPQQKEVAAWAYGLYGWKRGFIKPKFSSNEVYGDSIESSGYHFKFKLGDASVEQTVTIGDVKDALDPRSTEKPQALGRQAYNEPARHDAAFAITNNDPSESGAPGRLGAIFSGVRGWIESAPYALGSRLGGSYVAALSLSGATGSAGASPGPGFAPLGVPDFDFWAATPNQFTTR